MEKCFDYSVMSKYYLFTKTTHKKKHINREILSTKMFVVIILHIRL